LSVEFVDKCNVELIQTNADDDMVAMAAWVSNGLNSRERLKDRKRVAGLIKFLYRNRHMSPFEHGQFTFMVDVPLFVAREWQRHRTMSYNEISGRYTTMKPRFYIPPPERPVVQKVKFGSYQFIQDDEVSAIVRERLMKTAETQWASYQELLAIGAANEIARMEMPVTLMTQFYATVNPRNLMHFLSLRTDPQALHEIRYAAWLCDKALSDAMPLTYEAYSGEALPLSL